MTVAGDSANGTPAKVTQLASISGFKFLFEKLMNRFSKSFFASWTASVAVLCSSPSSLVISGAATALPAATAI